MLTLSDLQLGDIAQIMHLDVPGAADRQKLFACGLVPGAELAVVRIAPLGDPMQIKLEGDILLSVRKSEAKHVKVNRTNR